MLLKTCCSAQCALHVGAVCSLCHAHCVERAACSVQSPPGLVPNSHLIWLREHNMHSAHCAVYGGQCAEWRVHSTECRSQSGFRKGGRDGMGSCAGVSASCGGDAYKWSTLMPIVRQGVRGGGCRVFNVGGTGGEAGFCSTLQHLRGGGGSDTTHPPPSNPPPP